jgi:hypothetical protein
MAEKDSENNKPGDRRKLHQTGIQGKSLGGSEIFHLLSQNIWVIV